MPLEAPSQPPYVARGGTVYIYKEAVRAGQLLKTSLEWNFSRCIPCSPNPFAALPFDFDEQPADSTTARTPATAPATRAATVTVTATNPAAATAPAPPRQTPACAPPPPAPCSTCRKTACICRRCPCCDEVQLARTHTRARGARIHARTHAHPCTHPPTNALTRPYTIHPHPSRTRSSTRHWRLTSSERLRLRVAPPLSRIGCPRNRWGGMATT